MDVDEKHSTSPVPQQKVSALPSAQPKVVKGTYIQKNLNFTSAPSYYHFLLLEYHIARD